MRWILTSAILLAGCSTYNGAERSLVTEARKGVQLVASAESIRQKQSDAIAQERRARLDAAFDADVRDQKTLDPNWVIEQRKAYAAAMDQLALQASADRQLGATTAQNLSDVDLALQKLQLMIDVQQNLFDVKSLTQTSLTQQEGK